jgi:metallothionein
MTIEIKMVKCACADCVCIVEMKTAVKSEGRFYCSDECAKHHKDGSGCHHAGCTCHG